MSTSNHLTRDRKLWENEYATKAISSSSNAEPSHGVDYFAEWIPQIRNAPGLHRMLDLGCGGGRNITAFSATGLQYVGMDIAYPALAKTRDDVDPQVLLVQGSATQPLPFTDAGFRLVVAFTVLENVTSNDDLSRLASEVARVLTDGGYFYTYFLHPHDAYYAPLITPGPHGERWTFDPVTQLHQRVYEAEELAELFATHLTPVGQRIYTFDDDRSGGRYRRQLTGAMFRRVDLISPLASQTRAADA